MGRGGKSARTARSLGGGQPEWGEGGCVRRIGALWLGCSGMEDATIKEGVQGSAECMRGKRRYRLFLRSSPSSSAVCWRSFAVALANEMGAEIPRYSLWMGWGLNNGFGAVSVHSGALRVAGCEQT